MMITAMVMTAMGGEMELHMGLEVKVNRKGRGNERGSENEICIIRIVAATKMIMKMGVSNNSNRAILATVTIIATTTTGSPIMTANNNKRSNNDSQNDNSNIVNMLCGMK